jgi:hypothetical protein
MWTASNYCNRQISDLENREQVQIPGRVGEWMATGARALVLAEKVEFVFGGSSTQRLSIA